MSYDAVACSLSNVTKLAERRRELAPARAKDPRSGFNLTGPRFLLVRDVGYRMRVESPSGSAYAAERFGGTLRLVCDLNGNTLAEEM